MIDAMQWFQLNGKKAMVTGAILPVDGGYLGK